MKRIVTAIAGLIAGARELAQEEPVVARRIAVWASGGIAATIALLGFSVQPADVVTVLVLYLGVADVSATRRTRRRVYPERKVLEFIADAEGAPGAERMAPGEWADRT